VRTLESLDPFYPFNFGCFQIRFSTSTSLRVTNYTRKNYIMDKNKRWISERDFSLKCHSKILISYLQFSLLRHSICTDHFINNTLNRHFLGRLGFCVRFLGHLGLLTYATRFLLLGLCRGFNPFSKINCCRTALK